MTRIGLAVAGVGMVALLSACGGSDSDSDFTDQPGADIADASKTAMDKLDSVKASGTVTTGGQEITIDVQTNDQGDCTGTFGVGGGKAELLGVDGDIWFKPDETFWRENAGDSADQILAAVGDKWVVVPDTGGGFGDFCSIDDLLDGLVTSDKEDGETYKAKKVEDVDGEQAVPVEKTDEDDVVSTGYVLVDDPHYLVKIEKTEGDDTGSVTFSEFNEDFDVTAPAEGEAIDLDNPTG